MSKNNKKPKISKLDNFSEQLTEMKKFIQKDLKKVFKVKNPDDRTILFEKVEFVTNYIKSID